MNETEAAFVKKLIAVQFADQNATSIKHSAESQSRWYENRALLLYESVALALRCGLVAGIRIDPQDPEWPVVFLELPTGQISYHIKQHPIAWDNHTTEEKRLRILEYVADKIGM